ncbi:MAG: hypothetical protein DI585_04695 [Pseudomonas fluorescens]|nr:MAG: hypothetical protein DI585_04695 [Pseudomonas fluorescens]
MVRTSSPSKAASRKTSVSHGKGTRLDHIRPSLAAFIMAENPKLKTDALIDHATMAKYRVAQIQEILLDERGELSALDKEVAASIAGHSTISSNVEDEFVGKRSVGDMLADKIAAFGGSWAFILSFMGFLGIWIVLNVVHLFGVDFDPYPFILMNLILSCLAALQAPIIMMSQNRQEAKDRLRSENDYQINLKAELEIRILHEKLDHLVTKQWERMSEIQAIQTELLQDLAGRKKK